MMATIPNQRIDPKYLLRFLETVDLMPLSQATTVPSLRKGDLEQIKVPLPPLAEQQEFVRRVEALFALADQIEARYAKAKAPVEKLTQSILAKAFRGELVPQDPNDEPGSVLLERIEQEKVTRTDGESKIMGSPRRSRLPKLRDERRVLLRRDGLNLR
jgi:type I restriction enzyme S subunit